MTDGLANWLSAMPDAAHHLLSCVTVWGFLREERNRQFQLVGMYDGSMSAECKSLCREHYETLDAIVKYLDDSYERGAE